MSLRVALTDLTREQCDEIEKQLTITIQPKILHPKHRFHKKLKVQCWREIHESQSVALPFQFGRSLGFEPRGNEFETNDIQFIGTLREHQIPVAKQALEALNRDRSVFLALHVGWGKTTLALFLASRMKLPTLILTHRKLLIDQWQEEIWKFCGIQSIQQIKPKTKMLQEECCFFIANPLIVPRCSQIPWDRFGCVIVDEAHCIASKENSQALLYCFPKFFFSIT